MLSSFHLYCLIQTPCNRERPHSLCAVASKAAWEYAQSLHLRNSFPEHNLAPCPTGWPWRETITKEVEQQYPENICLCRLEPLTCLTVRLCWLPQRTHAFLEMLRRPRVRGPSLLLVVAPYPPPVRLPVPPASLTACLPSLAAAAMSEQTRARLSEQLFVWVYSLLLGWDGAPAWLLSWGRQEGNKDGTRGQQPFDGSLVL